MLNVVHVIARMNVGGPAFELQALQGEFPLVQVNSQIITGRCGPDEQDFLVNHSIDGQIWRIDELQRNLNVIRDLLAFLRIRRLIIDLNPDVLHTHTSKAGFLGRLAALTLRKRPKLIHTFHGHIFDGYFGSVGKFIFLNIERYLGHFTDLFLCIGSKTRDDIVQLGIASIENTRLVPTSIYYVEGSNRPTARKRLGISNDSNVIIYFGRLASVKRIDRLVEVISLVKKNLDVVWLIVGDGSEKGILEDFQRSTDRDVRLLGWRDDVQQILPACDLSILVSDNEGTPLSIVEAGYFGVPTICTDVGSVKDLITDQENGFIVEKDAWVISSSISAILKNKHDLLRISRNAKDHFRGNFSPYKSALIHADLYKEITK